MRSTDARPPLPATDAFAPLPYTAAQIRAACPVGRVLVFEHRRSDKPAFRIQVRYISASKDGTETEETLTDESGRALEPAKRMYTRWETLEKWGAFPRDRTTITDSNFGNEGGSFAVKLYVVKGDAGEERQYSFAKTMPGLPVSYSVVSDGGAKWSTTSLISVRRAAE